MFTRSTKEEEKKENERAGTSTLRKYSKQFMEVVE